MIDSMIKRDKDQCERLHWLFAKLVLNSAFAKEFMENPKAVLKKLRIKKEIADILVSRDLEAIQEMLEVVCGPGMQYIIIIGFH